MKIESSNNPLTMLKTGATRATSRVEAQDAVGSVQKTSAPSSTVSLSSMPTLRAANASDIDTAKVESIKAALRDGTYKIDSGNIADGMIGSVKKLLQARVG
ncbi:Negative regulator of flagellin synthesis [Candidatus Burkholderia humilis]|nr:Negative regulator of flagellin synthesis [Candidatus Burkholderia humilis]